MQLVWQQNGRLRVLDFSHTNAKLALAALLLIVALVLLGMGSAATRVNGSLTEVSRLGEAQQRYQAAEIRLAEQKSRLNAYAANLSRMQAHIIRLDAMGRHLTDMAGLDPADFSFGSAPHQGGRAPVLLGGSREFSDLGYRLQDFSQAIDERNLEISQLATLLLNRQLTEQVRPGGHPVSSGYISSFFGRRSDPISGRRMLHKGVDYAGRRGSEIVAVADGVVAESRFYGGFGNFVEINHGQGFVTRYAHNQKNLVTAGERVKRGQTIALLGSTGRATGPNLHFEVLKNGSAVDPMAFIEAK
ncbi:MAG: M23 family metallopeptidase [Gammaproteobacteria bacterium]|nr:M23 family metallopeptidase [Gammaproteobacteria bacterium]